MERQRSGKSNTAGAGSSHFAHRASAVLPASVSSFGGAGNISHAGVCESNFCGAAADDRRRDCGSGTAAPAPASPKEFDRLEQFAKLRSDDDKEKKDATRSLLDEYRAKSLAGKVTGILPINVSFPAFGPSIFLVSELTSENQSPAAQFNFQRDKKAGAR
jgi:hypothetical protein